VQKPKVSKFSVLASLQRSEDPDILQTLDESNFQWAKAWKAAVKETIKLKPQIVCKLKPR